MENTLPGDDNSMRFSLFQAWEQNKQTAMERYFPDVQSERSYSTTKWMAAGSMIAAGLEERPLPWWLSDIPPADISEYRIIEEFDGLRIRGTLDKFMKATNTVVDNKSLKRKMTAKEQKTINDKHVYTLEDFTSLKNKFDEKDAKKYKAQLVFYQVLVEKRYGSVDPMGHIEVIPVFEDYNGFIRRTGEPAEMVPVFVSDQERAEMKEKMVAAAKDIATVYAAYQRGDIKL